MAIVSCCSLCCTVLGMVYSCACNGEGGREVEGKRREKGRWGREGVRERERKGEREEKERERLHY